MEGKGDKDQGGKGGKRNSFFPARIQRRGPSHYLGGTTIHGRPSMLPNATDIDIKGGGGRVERNRVVLVTVMLLKLSRL